MAPPRAETELPPGCPGCSATPLLPGRPPLELRALGLPPLELPGLPPPELPALRLPPLELPALGLPPLELPPRELPGLVLTRPGTVGNGWLRPRGTAGQSTTLPDGGVPKETSKESVAWL